MIYTHCQSMVYIIFLVAGEGDTKSLSYHTGGENFFAMKKTATLHQTNGSPSLVPHHYPKRCFWTVCYLTLATKSDSNFLYGAIIYQFILPLLVLIYIISRKYKSNKAILYFIAWYFGLFLIASLRLCVLQNLIKTPLNHINKFNHLIGIDHYFFVLIS